MAKSFIDNANVNGTVKYFDAGAIVGIPVVHSTTTIVGSTLTHSIGSSGTGGTTTTIEPTISQFSNVGGMCSCEFNVSVTLNFYGYSYYIPSLESTFNDTVLFNIGSGVKLLVEQTLNLDRYSGDQYGVEHKVTVNYYLQVGSAQKLLSTNVESGKTNPENQSVTKSYTIPISYVGGGFI